MERATIGVDQLATGLEPDVLDILRSYTNTDPEQLRFVLQTLSLTELSDSVVSLESYLVDGDPTGHASVEYFIGRFERGEAVPPIIVRINYAGDIDVIDGFHRLAAAAATGRLIIDTATLLEDSC